MSRLRGGFRAALPLALVGLATSGGATQSVDSRKLLDRVWQGIKQAEQVQETGCGTLTETRASLLLARPLVLHGSFCAAGIDRFRVEYQGPEPARIIYNRGTLNVSTDGGKRTEALDVGSAVKRAQEYFAGPSAAQNLERDFSITVAESSDRYILTLVPVSGRIARRVKRVAVELRKLDFLPRRIEIDGKSGVNSVYEIEIGRLNEKLDESVFRVYHP